tara:strand:+ start:255 stop:554 length:300 start_codon:yes stop_codon:yes gene_type:complete
MNIFKGKEEIDKMNKSDVMEFMKELMFPNRKRGGIKVIEKNNRKYSQEHKGPNMSEYRPTIDGKGYTWGELNRYPNQLLKVLAYRLWQSQNKKYGDEEE